MTKLVTPKRTAMNCCWCNFPVNDCGESLCKRCRSINLSARIFSGRTAVGEKMIGKLIKAAIKRVRGKV